MEIAVAFGLFGLVCLGVGCFLGLPTTMEKAKIGDVISFHYLQPHHEDAPRSKELVVDKYRMTEEAISRLNATSGYRKHDPNFMRNGDLIVTESPDGQHRQYYTGRGIMVRKHILGSIARKLSPSGV